MSEQQLPQVKELELTDEGLIQAKTMTDLYRISKILHSSGMLPKAYDTPEKVMTGITMIKELGLAPLNGLRNLAIVNGTPSLWGELPLAMVRKSGLLESINEFLIDKDYKKICYENKNLDSEIFAAICEIKRKGEDVKSFAYTAQDASKNPNSKNAVWINYRSIMMKRRARSMAIKDEFGDVIGGMTIAEYDHDVMPSKGGESIESERSQITYTNSNLLDDINSKISNEIK